MVIKKRSSRKSSSKSKQVLLKVIHEVKKRCKLYYIDELSQGLLYNSLVIWEQENASYENTRPPMVLKLKLLLV